MFVLAEAYEFDWPVTVKVPVDGGIEEQSFTVRFRPLKIDEAETLAKEIQTARAADRERKTVDLLRRTIVGWRDLADARRLPIPFAKDVLDRLLNWPFIQIALFNAYQDAVSGNGALVGNSETPPAGGPAAASS